MAKITGILVYILFSFALIHGQIINRVRVLNHREYMAEVISEVVRDVEMMEWCNLKVRDFTKNVDENILNNHVTGTISHKNGFVVTIENIDILDSSLNQIWASSQGNVTVEIRGQLRMVNTAVGFDVDAVLDGSAHHYTGKIVYSMLTFDFSVFRNVHTYEMSVTVRGTQIRNTNVISYLPADNLTDTLSVLIQCTKYRQIRRRSVLYPFDTGSISDDVSKWATDIFQPVATDVITNRLKFPALCYDCPVL